MGFGAGSAPADGAVAALTPLAVEVPASTEPDVVLSVVEVGPTAPPTVSDVATFEGDAVVVEPVLLEFAADAELVPLPLQAQAAIAIEKRIERYIFPRSCQRLRQRAFPAG